MRTLNVCNLISCQPSPSSWWRRLSSMDSLANCCWVGRKIEFWALLCIVCYGHVMPGFCTHRCANIMSCMCNNNVYSWRKNLNDTQVLYVVGQCYKLKILAMYVVIRLLMEFHWEGLIPTGLTSLFSYFIILNVFPNTLQKLQSHQKKI